MKKKNWLNILIIVIIIILIAGAAISISTWRDQDSNNIISQPISDSKFIIKDGQKIDCLEVLSISLNDYGGDIWDEIPRAKIIKAKEWTPQQTIPFENLLKYTIKEEGLLGAIKRPRTFVVNNKYFGDLRIADATQLNLGENIPIGKVKDLSFSALKLRDIAKFLLEAKIINTYWHLGSKLCLKEEKESMDSTEYGAFFTGSHEYCTNECVEDPLNFIIKINKENGDITLSSWTL